jgi:hypothetical protein
MERVGIAFDDVDVGRKPAYFTHFPALKRIPVKEAGRLSQKIATILTKSNFLQEWHIKMRYSQDGHVTEPNCTTWKEQVSEFNNSCMGI